METQTVPVQASQSKRQVIKPPTQGDGDGRRSKRVKVKPLAFWRNERIVYSLGDREGGEGVPQIKEIVLIDSPVPKPAGRTSSVRSSTRQHNKRGREEDDETEQSVEVYGDIVDYVTGKRTNQLLAVSGKKIPFRKTPNPSVTIATTFKDDKEFIASGMLLLNAGGEKEVKFSKHNAFAFCMISGSVEAMIEESKFEMHRGGHWIVPRGSLYGMRNIGNDEARIFYTQATDTLYNAAMEEEQQN
ncbi:Mif2/CENP-C like-domain-containing protein [Lipomyces arxii]|uniref:Mif2/CENP-C like-domain-containing protein n=1 Tax=Lipomyces arxii TaxID=56418 RepID=UPI0034CDC594